MIKNFVYMYPEFWTLNYQPGLFGSYRLIFTFPLRVFKWTFTFEMLFIASWTEPFKPRQHALFGRTIVNAIQKRCLLTLSAYRHDVKRRNLVFWLFPTLR